MHYNFLLLLGLIVKNIKTLMTVIIKILGTNQNEFPSSKQHTTERDLTIVVILSVFFIHFGLRYHSLCHLANKRAILIKLEIISKCYTYTRALYTTESNISTTCFLRYEPENRRHVLFQL